MTERRNKNNVNYAAAVMLSVIVVFFSAASAKLFAGIDGVDIIVSVCVISAAAAAFFACLLFVTNYLTIFAVCAVSLALSLFIGKEIICVIFALSYIPAGLIIFTGIIKKRTRTQITVRISLFLVLFYAALIILYFFITAGGFTLNMISSLIDGEITDFYNGMVNTVTQLNQYSSAAQTATVTLADVDAAKQEFMMNTKVVVPSVFIVFGIFCAYLSTSVFRVFYNIFSVKSKSKEIQKKDWRINLSVISAGMMLLSAITAVLVHSEDNLLPSIAAANIMYILFPGFCVMGIYFVYDKLYNMYNRIPYRKKTGVLPALSMVFALMFLGIFQLSSVMLVILTILGIYSVLIGDIKKFYDKAKKYFTDGGGGDDDNDGGDDF